MILRLAAGVARVLPQGGRDALYRLGPISDGLRKMLTRAAPDGLVPIFVAAGPLSDTCLKVDLTIEKDFWLGTYEPETLDAIGRLLNPGDVAYDIGAHIGYETLMMARAVGPTGRVIAFEALPSNLERLRENMQLNDEGERVEVAGVAVGAVSGAARFLVHDSAMMGKLEDSDGRRAAYPGSIEVEAVTIDEWVFDLGRAAPHMVKIDVEGGEALVVKGMRRTLAEYRPRLLVELHGPRARRRTGDLLREAGYRLHELSEGFPPFEAVSEWKAHVVALAREDR